MIAARSHPVVIGTVNIAVSSGRKIRANGYIKAKLNSTFSIKKSNLSGANIFIIAEKSQNKNLIFLFDVLLTYV